MKPILQKMKAAEYTTYGPPEVLNIVERPKPEPAPNEFLVRIYATTVTATECTFRKGKPWFSRLFTGINKPKITVLGEEMAGEVVEVGEKVTSFKKGDLVFGTAGPKFGANAEFIAMPETSVLSTKPENCTFGEAAGSVDGFLTAMPFLRDVGKLKEGQEILILGASGSVGSAAVQIAKYFGAEVTGVCSSANVELVKNLGADHVIDYKREDYTRFKSRYDVIFDAVGKTTFGRIKKSLKPKGVFLEAGITLSVMPMALGTSLLGRKKAKVAATGLRAPEERLKDLQLLKQLLEHRKIKPVIDRKYPFEEIVEAHRYVDTGRKKGNVVIVLHPDEEL
jgi:NADPH:quinone reductase-like Zn-dependent oxidoreductase